MLLGDAANVASFILALGYLVFVLAHAQGALDVFAESIQDEGFCVSNKGKHVMIQSHMLC